MPPTLDPSDLQLPPGSTLAARYEPPDPDAQDPHARAGRLIIDAPSLGLWRSSFGMAIIGPLIIAVPLVILLRSGGGFTALTPGIQAWLVTLWAVGALLALIGTDLGTARTTLSAGPAGLACLRRSRLRTTHRTADPQHVESLKLIEAPVTAGNQPLLRLQITLHHAKPIRTLTARPEADLQWAKTSIEQALAAPPPDSASS